MDQRDHGSVGTHHAPFRRRLICRSMRGFSLSFLRLNHVHPRPHLLSQATSGLLAHLHAQQIAEHPGGLLKRQATGQMHQVLVLARCQTAWQQG